MAASSEVSTPFARHSQGVRTDHASPTERTARLANACTTMTDAFTTNAWLGVDALRHFDDWTSPPERLRPSAAVLTNHRFLRHLAVDPRAGIAPDCRRKQGTVPGVFSRRPHFPGTASRRMSVLRIPIHPRCQRLDNLRQRLVRGAGLSWPACPERSRGELVEGSPAIPHFSSALRLISSSLWASRRLGQRGLRSPS